MQESFFKEINEFKRFLQQESIQMTYTKFNSIIAKFSYFFVDHENHFERDINQLKNQVQIIIVDKYKISDGSSAKNYFIISFTDTVIIVEQEHLPLIKFIFTINDKTTFYFLSNTKKLIQNLLFIEYQENDKEVELFQTEINNFLMKFSVQTSNPGTIIKIWNIIKTSISGYLIKKSYSKSMNRINNFFTEKVKEKDCKFNDEEYIFLRNIGQGSSGVVSLVYHIEKGELFAIKNFFDVSNEKNQNREITNYETISHPLIAKFYGIKENERSKDIIIEYINGIELQDCLNLQRNEKLKIIFEIMIIFEYLHNNHYVYRDLKPNNIIIDQNKTAILVDFDRMIKCDDSTNSVNSTTMDFFSIYCAPEISEGRVSYASDIYSIGMMIYFILTIELQNNKNIKFKQDLVDFNNIPNEFLEFQNIIKKCVNKNQEERPNISELIDEFYMNFYSTIDNEGKFAHFIDNEIIKCTKYAHDQYFFKYWVSLAEFDNPFSKVYSNSVHFYKQMIPNPIRFACIENSKNEKEELENDILFFEDLTNDYQALKNCIQNECIQKLYSKFNFLYCNFLNIIQNQKDQNDFQNHLFEYLKEFKFITYQFINSTSKPKVYDAVIICVEDKCFIIENVIKFQVNELISKIKENGSSMINVSNISREEVKEEIKNFCYKFHEEMENNKFVSLTISSIACYLIRRYFYPTEYFKDKSFFIFGEHNEKEMQIELMNLIKSNKDEEILFKLNLMKDQIINERRQQISVQEFKEEDFIILRPIIEDNQTICYLVFHLDSQHIFLMKKINNINKMSDEIKHEKNICEQNKNRIFVPFYGFLKKDENIIGFVYEYMTNSSFESSQIEIMKNPIYSLSTLARLLEGIEYISKNSLIIDNYKLSNILIDHDYNLYISNFSYSETHEENESHSDINLFCQILNYLCDNENSSQNDNKALPKLENIKDIKTLYECYSKNNQNNLSIYDYIRSVIIEEMKSFENLEQSLLNEKNNLKLSNIVQFYFEYVLIQDDNSTELETTLKKITLLIFLYLRKHENDKSNLSYMLGYLYDSNNEIVKKDIKKVKKYHEISIQLNNKHDLVNMGNLYVNGRGVVKDYNKAKELYELAAKQNDPRGYIHLGLLYRHGYGVKRDYSKTIEYYKKASQLEDPLAYITLGFMHVKGLGVERNYHKAKEFYEIAAKMNSATAYNYLGDLYEQGLGVQQNYIKAKEYYELAARLNDPNAPLYIGKLYYYGYIYREDYLKAKEYFELSAKKYNSRALCYLANMYEQGFGVNQNYMKAKEYYELSAQLNESDALFNLGRLYEEGKGVEKNYTKAIEYYEAAAKSNNSHAFCNLGNLYSSGKGVQQNHQKAIEYYEMAANLSNRFALCNLGNCYYYGDGVEQNYLRAKEYYELAAQLNEPISILKLGYMYEKGEGVKQNYIKAREYYELSARLNNPEAFYNLGCMYSNGVGVRQNYTRAKEYFELAAYHKNSNALLNLGIFYEYGKGVAQNYLKAKEYYELSANLNNSNAFLNLGNFYYCGKGVEKNCLKAQKYFELSAKLHNKKAYLNLGAMHLDGIGVKQDFQIAKEYFELSINEPYAYYGLGVIYMFGLGVAKDYLISKEYFELAAKQNIPEALFNLGHFYDFGFGVEQNFAKSKKYYELAAKLNNSNAFLYLGFQYESGHGVKQDYLKAKNYYELSIQSNNKNSTSFYRLGHLYLLGHGVEKDVSNAIKYFEMSAKLNSSDALGSLSSIYLHGFGVGKDHLKAKEYLELSAKLNNSDALCSLGILYYDELYFPKDYLKAKQYFELAAALDNSRAIYFLGLIYSNGNGVKQNYLKAIELYEKAGNLGNSDAFVSLGFLYHNGLGVKKDSLKAKKYFELAATLNNSTACCNLGSIYLFGYGVEKNYSKAKEYFELSASLDNSIASFKLGVYYSIGNVFDVDIEKSIYYYKKCLEKHYSTINNDLEITKYNEFYYHASNDLGLIYITVFNDTKSLELGFNYIKEAGLNEYPFGRNNLGLLYQYYTKNIENAKYMYQRSLEDCFPLAAYNLGFLNEIEGNIEKSIEYYMKASEYENKPMIYRGKYYYDERLSISTTFIICFTNLKLFEYFYSKKDIQSCKEYLSKSLSKINSKEFNSEFKFKLNKKDLKLSFSYLMVFIFNFGPFNLINQPNLDQKIKEEIQNLIKNYFDNEINDPKNDFESIKEQKEKVEDENENENKLSNKLNQSKFDSKYNNNNNSSSSFKSKENKFFLMKQEKVKNEKEKIFVFSDVVELFDFVMRDEKLLKEFINEIRHIIEVMQKIIYSPPCLILYGRISFEKPKIQNKNDISKFMKNINESFYEGFEDLYEK